MNIKETKKRIIQAGHKAVEELIKVAKEAIVDSDDDISADISSSESTIGSLATLISSSTAFCPAWIILFFVSFVFIFNCNKLCHNSI